MGGTVPWLPDPGMPPAGSPMLAHRPPRPLSRSAILAHGPPRPPGRSLVHQCSPGEHSTADCAAQVATTPWSSPMRHGSCEGRRGPSSRGAVRGRCPAGRTARCSPRGQWGESRSTIGREGAAPDFQEIRARRSGARGPRRTSRRFALEDGLRGGRARRRAGVRGASRLAGRMGGDSRVSGVSRASPRSW